MTLDQIIEKGNWLRIEDHSTHCVKVSIWSRLFPDKRS